VDLGGLEANESYDEAGRWTGNINFSGTVFPKMSNYTENNKATSIGNQLLTNYKKYLLPYEQAFAAVDITYTPPPMERRPVVEKVAHPRAPRSRPSKERQRQHKEEEPAGVDPLAVLADVVSTEPPRAPGASEEGAPPGPEARDLPHRAECAERPAAGAGATAGRRGDRERGGQGGVVQLGIAGQRRAADLAGLAARLEHDANAGRAAAGGGLIRAGAAVACGGGGRVRPTARRRGRRQLLRV